MAKIWKEKYDPKKHRSVMRMDYAPISDADRLIPQWMYFVRIFSFTFIFTTIHELQVCLDFFEKKIHPSSIIPWKNLIQYGGDQGETQRWYEKLPLWLFEEPKRIRIVKTFRQALQNFNGAKTTR